MADSTTQTAEPPPGPAPTAPPSIPAPTAPTATATSPHRGFDWREIEPILKWGAVAYGLGFLTVMVHTSELGIPVLQVMEPLNVWIGAPLAVAVFFSKSSLNTCGAKQTSSRQE